MSQHSRCCQHLAPAGTDVPNGQRSKPQPALSSAFDTTRYSYAYVPAAASFLAMLVCCRDLEAVAWLRSSGCEWTSSTATAAAAGGHLQLLQYMTSQLPPCPINAGACAEAAAARGHLPVLMFLLQQHMCSYFDIGVCAEAAARAGHLDVLKWLAEQRPVAVADTGVCAEAAAAGEQAMQARLVQAYQRNITASAAVQHPAAFA